LRKQANAARVTTSFYWIEESNMSIEHIHPDGLFKMPGFTQVVKSTGGNRIYVAGQGAFDKDMNLIGAGDYQAQACQAFNNLALALASAGANPEDIVSTVMYVVDLNADNTQAFIAGMNEALDGKGFPANASSLIGVKALAMEGMLVEISGIAEIN
jgi:enamine deaminase RidA (YjgF/YER057c/UK114 family)